MARLSRDDPDAAEIRRRDQTLRELANFQPRKTDLEALRTIADRLMKLPAGPASLPVIDRASQHLKGLPTRSQGRTAFQTADLRRKAVVRVVENVRRLRVRLSRAQPVFRAPRQVHVVGQSRTHPRHLVCRNQDDDALSGLTTSVL